MKCAMCSQRDVDGAVDDSGEYVCVDCWASGEARFAGRTATSFMPAIVPYSVNYPSAMQQRFLDACNGAPAVEDSSCQSG